jgi:type II secretion system protein I
MILRPSYSRRGLTLLEVIVAMAIFLFSLAAIQQLVTMGSDRAMDIRQETRTSSRCQSKMAELIIGAAGLTASGDYTPFEDEDGKDLFWKVDVAAAEDGVGLYLVKVFVKKDFQSGRTIESQMSQIIMDPSMRGTSLDRALPPATPTP